MDSVNRILKLLMVIWSVSKSTCNHDNLALPEMGLIFCSNVENTVPNWVTSSSWKSVLEHCSLLMKLDTSTKSLQVQYFTLIYM